MEIKYPVNVHNDKRHTLFLYRLKELMRLRHNEEGAKYKHGVITEAEWKQFLKWWDPRSDCISSEILFYRAGLKSEIKYDKFLDLETVFL